MPARVPGPLVALVGGVLVLVAHLALPHGHSSTSASPASVVDPLLHGCHDHIVRVLNPFLMALRDKLAFVMYSQPGGEDPIRKKLYRSLRGRPTDEARMIGKRQLHEKLNSFNYRAESLPEKLMLSSETPVVSYFKQFPGLDSGSRYNGEGFWDLPIPVVRSIETHPDDVLIYDEEGYEPLRDFLKSSGVRHVLLTGYATDMCYRSTCAGYENLSRDFNVFLVGDATLATFPANSSPAYATNASISFASINQLITQVSWIRFVGKSGNQKSAPNS